MKSFFLAFIIFVSVPIWAQNQSPLVEISVKSPIQVKDKNLLKITNQAIYGSVYYEDGGREFQQLADSKDVSVVGISVDKKWETQSLKLTASARVGGYGWHSGYQEGFAYCDLEIEKVKGVWPTDGKELKIDCEVELD